MKDKFNKEILNTFLPDSFKSLSKEYLLTYIFDKKFQKKWIPSIGDIIVGCTGNIFVISNVEYLHESLGGTKYYFGGNSCNRNGGIFLDDTICFTANESCKYYHPVKGETHNSNHSSIRDFRFVPYPHELEKYNIK